VGLEVVVELSGSQEVAPVLAEELGAAQAIVSIRGGVPLVLCVP
jgi:hypothetical protein